ncbi:ATP-binding protein [Actinoplanes sp. NPDC049316]|uniref:ATP-binding protein n=1 Tax=Actinoplanes sp. NPDC049316 TaxID=3154727 RepID=UPI00344A8E53
MGVSNVVMDEGDGSFRHAAVITGSDDELVAALMPELRRSADAYDEVLMVVGERLRGLLTTADGDLAGALRWGDHTAFYQRLGFAYEGFRRYLAEQHDAGRRVHVVAEPDLTAGAVPDRSVAYLAYEAACNDVYAPYACPVTCIWDSRHHAQSVIDGARAAHGHLMTPEGVRPSPQYLAPERFLSARRDPPLPAPPGAIDHDVVLHEVEDLGPLRSLLCGWVAAHGFAPAAAEDVVVAVMEIVTNGLRHGRPPVRVRAWHEAATLIVQCDDAGGRRIPPGAGFHRPRLSGATPGGRGLWLARQLADVVMIESAAGRTTVRLSFPYEPLHRAEN